MKHKKVLLGLMLAELGLMGAAEAAMYENAVTETTPFGISIDSGSTAWEAPSAYLDSSDTGVVQGTHYYLSDPAFVTEIIEPKVGVEGAINFYKERIQSFYDYAYQTQSFDMSYTARLSEPSTVPQTYVLTGQVENLIGAALVNGGHGYTGFSMGLSPQFAEPYVPDSGSATLSFRFGTAPGTWSYSFEKTFDLSSGSISLNHYIGDSYWYYDYLDLSGMAYFEATYTIDGTPGIVVNASSLSLGVWGSAHTWSETYSHDVVERELLSSVPTPALAVPEIESYAMMLAGLAVVGFAARRRTRTTV